VVHKVQKSPTGETSTQKRFSATNKLLTTEKQKLYLNCKPANRVSEQNKTTYNCGDEGAVEIGVSVRANPTPSLDAFLWPSECSFASARPATVFGGGIKVESFPDPGLPFVIFPFIVAVLRLLIAERAMSECCAMPCVARRGRRMYSGGCEADR
jgi:hypothetical protein